MKTEIDDLVVIRPIEGGDEAFIFSTFLRGLYYGNSWFKEIDKDTFMEKYHLILQGILANPSTKTNMAVLKEDKDTILGYSITDPKRQIIHWIYVKEAWRKSGIAKKLTEGTFNTTTHLTDLVKSFKPKQIMFNPFAL